MKTLYEICEDVVDIEEGLMTGTISFHYDNLMSAIKPGHSMLILDSILATIFFDVQAGIEPPREKTEKTIADLREFKKTFGVKELARPIRNLSDYLKRKGQQDRGP